jgi:Histidine kinase-, DNA gyrase B-, and HSP90-like ATPase
MATNPPTYRMKLDLNVLNHLGLNLYSNVSAVLSEAVANSWDADADEVRVIVNAKNGLIEIRDDGVGMTIADANDRFLNVGYSKRQVEGANSLRGRRLMGRKGIGKLSLFSIAQTVTLVSVKGGQLHGFRMSTPDLERAIKSGSEYYPVALATPELPQIPKGTLITLSNLRRRATSQTVDALRKRIARRFSVIGAGFKVFVNQVEVSVTDRDDLAKAQFLWELADPNTVPMQQTRHIVRRDTLAPYVTVEGRQYQVGGWIASAKMPRDLSTDDAGNLNSIVVLAHGRLIQENILDRVNMGGIFTKYLTGQIEADFLDLDDQDDIATSDRQRIIEDDARYQGLLSFVRASLNQIESQWAEWRAEFGTKEVVQLYPKIAAWIEGLPPTSRAHAKRVLGTIQGLSVDSEEKRRELLRHGLMAFERLRLTECTAILANALETRAEDILPLLGEQDQLEAALYLDIVRGRLGIIKRFTALVDANAKEKVLQEYLFDHLWLLDAAWERAAGSQRMEERVHNEFGKLDADLTDEEKAARIDIKYRTMAGKHVIIELKRYSVIPSVYDLAKQGEKYISATKQLLVQAGRGHEPVEIVFVIGTQTRENDPSRDAAVLEAAFHGRLRTYEQLIQGAIASYGEFVQEREKVDTIEALFQLDPASPALEEDSGRTKSPGDLLAEFVAS